MAVLDIRQHREARPLLLVTAVDLLLPCISKAVHPIVLIKTHRSETPMFDGVDYTSSDHTLFSGAMGLHDNGRSARAVAFRQRSPPANQITNR